MTDVQRARHAITRVQKRCAGAGALGLTAVAQRLLRDTSYRRMYAGKTHLYGLEEVRLAVQGHTRLTAHGLTRRPANDLWCVA